jgi:cell shape-determining protein MreC
MTTVPVMDKDPLYDEMAEEIKALQAHIIDLEEENERLRTLLALRDKG